MAPASKTFRVFVSSTFSDLKAEREALQERVFPSLRELCAAHGCSFQAIDLRWGISQEASRDQQTMNICLKEIRRCQQVTPRPNFIVLLGDRYGWRPLPSQISAEEFDSIRMYVSQQGRALLEEWYLCDENAIPPEYVLQSWDGYTYEEWDPIEAMLHRVLEEAAEAAGLDDASRFKYWASATHQEIAVGALQREDAAEHVFCFFRTIQGLPGDVSAKGFRDLDDSGRPLKAAHLKLDALKAALDHALGSNVMPYVTTWADRGPAADHIDQLCEDVFNELKGVIEMQLNELKEVETLEADVAAHKAFGEERCRIFTGRTGYLRRIADYIEAKSPQALAIWGEPGSGKSALLSRAVQEARKAHPEAEVIYRFIGATPESSNGRALLESLCRQISRRYGVGDSDIPLEYRNLVREFPKRLALATPKKPLILFLDALDQLTEMDNARNLAWLPTKLPAHVHMVVSTLPEKCRDELKAKLPQDYLVELEPLLPEEAENLLDLWLKDARRSLQPVQRAYVLGKSTKCPRPLYLKLVFEEIRRWRSYDGLPGALGNLPHLSEDVSGIIRDLFARLSSEANHGDLLVSRSLGYLAAAKNGLTEDELLDILARDAEVYVWFVRSIFHTPPDLVRRAQKYLGERRDGVVSEEAAEGWLEEVRRKENEGQLRAFLSAVLTEGAGLHLPVVLWSRLYADLESYLAQQNADGANPIVFYHPATFDQAVRETFLGGDLAELRHQALASYFKTLPLRTGETDTQRANRRKLSELPYQQAFGHLWNGLQSTLTDFDFLQAKVSAVGPQLLIEDYEVALSAGYQEQDLAVIRSALTLSAHVLARDPAQLAGQLVGRLMTQEATAIQGLIEKADQWGNAPWLRPLNPALIAPGDPLVRILEGHTHSVASVTVTPDGTRAVSGSADKTLRVWDLDRGVELHTLTGHKDGIEAVTVTSDSRLVVSASHDHTLKVWDLERGVLLRTMMDHTAPVLAVALTPDSRHVISGSIDTTLKIWDIETGEQVQEFTYHKSAVFAVEVSQEGFLISASLDGMIKVWDLGQKEVVRTFSGDESGVFAMAASPDRQRLVTGSGSGSIQIWDLKRGILLRTLSIHEKRVTGLSFIPNSRRFVSTSTDCTVKMGHLEIAEEFYTLGKHSMQVWAVAVTPDGRHTLSASMDNTLKVWSAEARPQATRGKSVEHSQGVTALVATPDGKRLVSASRDHTLKVWRLKPLMELFTLRGHASGVLDVAVDLDGCRAVSSSDDRTLKLWDLVGGKGVLEMIGHTDIVWSVAMTPDSYVVSGSQDGTIKVWDYEWGVNRKTLVGHTDWVRAVAVTPDGKRVVSGSKDRTLKVWDLGQGRELGTLIGHQDAVWALAVTPDGKRAVSGSLDRTLRVWDLNRMAEVAALKDEGWILDIAITPDGRHAVSSSHLGMLKLWDLSTFEVIAAFSADDALAGCTALADGLTFAAGGSRGRIYTLELRGIAPKGPKEARKRLQEQPERSKDMKGENIEIIGALQDLEAQIAKIPKDHPAQSFSFGAGANQAKEQIPIICRNIADAISALRTERDPRGNPITPALVRRGLLQLVQATKRPEFETLMTAVLDDKGFFKLKGCLEELEQIAQEARWKEKQGQRLRSSATSFEPGRYPRERRVTQEEAGSGNAKKPLNEWVDRWATDIRALQRKIKRKKMVGWGAILLGVMVGGTVLAPLHPNYTSIRILLIIGGLAFGILWLARSRSFHKQAVKHLVNEINQHCRSESISKSDAVEKLWKRQIKGSVCNSVLSSVDPHTLAMLDLRRHGTEFFEDESQSAISPMKFDVDVSNGTISRVTLEGEKAVERFSNLTTDYLGNAAYIESIASLATLQGIYTQIAPPGGEMMIATAPDSHPLKQATLSAHKIISSFDFKSEVKAVYEMLAKKRTQSLLGLLQGEMQGAKQAIEKSHVDISALSAPDPVFVGACIDYLGKLSNDFFKRTRIAETLAFIPDMRTLPYILKAFGRQAFFPQGIEAVLRMGKIARDKLLEAFKGGTAFTRFNTGVALGIIDPQGVKPEMENSLHTFNEPLERISCYYALAQAGDVNAVSEIAAFLEATDEGVCHGAAIALEHLPYPVDEKVLRQHLNHRNGLVRLRVVRKLGAQGTDAPALWDDLLGRFGDDDEKVRSAAAEAVAKLDTNRIYNRVFEAAKEGTIQSRICAYNALGKLGNHNAVHLLASSVEGTRDNDLRRAAISALGELGAVEALGYLEPQLKNHDLSNAVYWAVLRIGLTHREAALQSLQDQRNEPKAVVVRALLGEKDAKDEYRRLLSSSKDVTTLVTALEFAPLLRDPEFEKPMRQLITYRRHTNFPGDRYVPYLAVRALVHIMLAKLAQKGAAA